MKNVIISLVCLLLISCGKDNDDNLQRVEDKNFTISTDLYENTPSDHFEILSASISGDFLTLKISSGGCQGNSWEGKLIASSENINSVPPQRKLKFVLKNEETCLAIATRNFTFNISSLKTREKGSLLLEIEKFDSKILYEF